MSSLDEDDALPERRTIEYAPIQQVISSDPQPSSKPVRERVLEVLRGGLTESISCPTFEQRVFVSSTFSDTQIERDVLMEKILPNLLTKARSHGIRVVIVDMRYGVPEEATRDHFTWTACERALQSCIEVSQGIFCLSMQGLKYGYRALPKYIDEQSFEERLRTASEEDVALARKWFSLDQNNIAPVYVLNSLTNTDENDFWNLAKPRLLTLFDGVPLPPKALGECKGALEIGQSVTEWETRMALAAIGDRKLKNDQNGWSAMNSGGDGDAHEFVFIHRDFNVDIVEIISRQEENISVLGSYISEHACTKISDVHNILQNILQNKNCSSDGFMFPSMRTLETLSKKSSAVGSDVSDEVSSDMIEKLDSVRKCMERELEEIKRYCDIYGSDEASTDIKSRLDALKKLILKCNIKERKVECNLTAVFQNSKDAKDIDASEESKNSITKGTQLRSNYEEVIREEFESIFYCSLKHLIEFKSNFDENAFETGLSGRSIGEILHHTNLAAKKCDDFIGLDYEIENAMDMIYSNSECRNEFGASLVIRGPLGSGKSEFMSRLANDCYEKEQKHFKCSKRPVIIRFCGSSGDSTTGLGLLRGLCSQIMALSVISPEELRKREKQLYFQGFEDVRKVFYTLISETPILLFIDDLDQLSDENEARTDISFLRGVKPHPLARIIISIEESNSSDLNRNQISYSGSLRLDQEEGVKILEIDRMSTHAEEILNELLKRRGRQLTEKQMEHTLKCVSKNHSYPALSLRLLAMLASQKASSDGLDFEQSGIIEQVLFNLEVDCGKELVAFALGCIAYSAAGIQDLEMIDLISSDEVVRPIITKYWKLKDSTLFPIHIWLSLKERLQDLLAPRKGGKVVFNHRQLQNAVKVRYGDRVEFIRRFASISSNDLDQLRTVRSCQEAMAIYFGDLGGGVFRCSNHYNHQPLTLNGDAAVWLESAVVNSRRCVEAAYHMIRCGMLVEAISELCRPEVICAYCKVGLGPTLVQHLNDLKVELDSGRGTEVSVDQRKQVHDYRKWLHRDITRIACDPSCLVFLLENIEKSSRVITDCKKYWDENLEVVSYVPKNKETFIAARIYGDVCRNSHLLELDLHGHSKTVSSIVWSPDSKHLVSGSDDHSVKIWDVEKGELLYTFHRHKNVVSAVAWSYDGEFILSSSWDNTVVMWDVRTGHFKVERDFPGNKKLHSVSWSPYSKGKSFAVGGDKAAFLCHLRGSTIEVMRILNGHEDPIRSIAWSPDGSSLVTGSEDKSIRLWDADGRKTVKVLPTKFPVISVAWSPGGQYIALAGVNIYTCEVSEEWDKGALKLHQKYNGPKAIQSVAWSPKAGKLLAAGKDNMVRVIAGNDSAGLQSNELTLVGHTEAVTSVAWSPNGQYKASCGKDCTIKIWSEGSEDEEISERGNGDRVDAFYIKAVALAPEGRYVLAGRKNGSIKIWDIESRMNWVNRPHIEAVNSVAWSTDANYFVSGGADKIVYIQSFANFAVSTKIACKGHTDAVSSVAFSPDGLRFASGSLDCTIKIWNSRTGECESTFRQRKHTPAVSFWRSSKNPQVLSVAWSSTGDKIIVASEDFIVRLWDVMSRVVTLAYSGHSQRVICAVSSPDGKKIISGSDDDKLLIWDAISGETLLNASREGLSSLVWPSSESGSIIVGDRNGVHILETDGAVQKTLRGHSSAVKCISCTSDMRHMVSAGEASSAVIVHSVVRMKKSNT